MNDLSFSSPPAPTPDLDPTVTLLDAKQLAQALQLPVSWVKEQTDAGQLPCLRLGQKTRYNLAAVAQAVMQQASQAHARPKRKKAAPVADLQEMSA